MHSTGVVIASLLVAAASVVGVLDLSTFWVVLILAAGVTLIGVPHGGLDHLTGRRLLLSRFPNTWALIFFPAYLVVAAIVAAGWFVVPTVTVIGFFLLSAWHFGLEDERFKVSSKVLGGLNTLAIGGMVIWIPMLTRPEEVSSILETIIPSNMSVSAEAIVMASQIIAWALLPVLLLALGKDLQTGNRARFARNAAFCVLFATANVLLSFAIYFCCWHSIRGLQRLARSNSLGPWQLIKATAPLTFGAIGLAGVGMWFWSSGQMIDEAVSRTVFVALSAMAVPHLVLHGPVTDGIKKLIGPSVSLNKSGAMA